MGSLVRCIASLRPFESHPNVPGFRESAARAIDCVVSLRRLYDSFIVLDRFKKDHQITRRFVRSLICGL
jgi:hypothetical protein